MIYYLVNNKIIQIKLKNKFNKIISFKIIYNSIIE